MSINKFNSEGYYDPTTYEALTNIEKEERALRAFRPIVYICSPYAGDVAANVENARRYSRFAVDAGYSRICCFRSFSVMTIQRSVSWGCSLETP